MTHCIALPFSRRTPLCLAIAAACLMLGTAHAQTQPTEDKPKVTEDKPQAKEAVQALDSVTVTATRRREPVRDVPTVVNTLSVPQLERSGATGLSDYIGGLPGVDVKSDGGPGRSQVSIRGVTTGDQTIATVGTYVDEVAFGSNSAFVGGAGSALDLSLLDLNHIELLRGPQGTLYGAGAMGGLLKYVTNEPDTFNFSGKVTLGVRQTKNGGIGHTESAVVNVPLKDDVAGLRIAAFHDREGGFVDATGLAAGRRVNSGNSDGFRASLLVEPSSRFKVRLTATEQNLKRDGLNYVNYDIVTGQLVDGDLKRPLSTREPYQVRIRLGSADVEYDLGWARFNSITSVQRLNGTTALDETILFAPVLTQAIGTPVDASGLTNTVSLRKTTQEFRLTSARGTVEWLAGLYYDMERGSFDQVLWGRVAADGSVFNAITTGQPSTYKELAAYGDLTFNVTPEWSLTGGARLARNQQVYTSFSDQITAPEAQSADTSKTYLATVRYSLSKVSNIYFRAASGYRPGGPNPIAIDVNGQPVPDSPKSFKPDSLWSYELGYKADLLDKTLAIEGSVYDIRWSDIQQPLVVGATTVNTNAGKAHVQGLEVTARWRPTPQWTLDGSFSFVDAKLSEGTASLGPSGTRLPNTAKYSGTLGMSRQFALASYSAYAGANVRYVGQRNAGFDVAGSSMPNFVLPAYTLIDLQGGVEVGAFELGLFVRNLADRRALLGANTALVAFGFPLQANVAQPRTIGVTLAAKF